MLVSTPGAESSAPTVDSRAAWRIFITLLFGTFVAIEAAAFQSPALSFISRHFGIPVTAAALILLLYYLGATVFAPVMGGLGDQIGRKRMVMIGLGVFAGAEFLAAVSPNFYIFLGARFLQGLGVACILPVVLAMIGQLFPAEKRGLPLGVMAFSMSLGAITGALIAGLLIDNFGWPSIYWVSGGLALVGLVLVALLVPHMPPPVQKRGFDVRGTFLLLLTLGGLLAVPILAGNFGMGSWVALGSLALGLICAVLLWWSCERLASPVIEISLLRQRAFVLPSVIYLLHLLCYGGAVYSLAFIIADRPGGNASQVGFINLFIYGASALAAPLAGRLVDRIDPRKVLICAMAITLFGLVLFAQIRSDTPLWMIAMIATLLGLMTGGKTPAVMKIALGTIPEKKMGRGTGLLTMLRDLGVPAGSSFSLAIYGATVGSRTQAEVLARAEGLGLGTEWHSALMAAVGSRGRQVEEQLVEVLAQQGLTFADLMGPATGTAISSALPLVGYALAGVMVVALTMACLLPRGKQKPPEDDMPVDRVGVAAGSS